MKDSKQLIEQFYYELWNKKNEKVAWDILSPDFRFRGSLGTEKYGVEGFLEYMRSIHVSLSDYECIIEELVITEYKAAAKMRFRGHHQADFLGVPPMGRQI